MRWVAGLHERPHPDICIEPMFDWELENMLNRHSEKSALHNTICFPTSELIWGPRLEVSAVETFSMEGEDFLLTEMLWQISVPKMNRESMNYLNNLDNGRKKEPWSNIRDFFIDTACKYQTSVKLWDAQTAGNPLFQEYPDFIKAEELDSPLKRMKLDVPDEKFRALARVNKLINSCGAIIDKYQTPFYRNLSQKDCTKLYKGINKVLAICSNIVPNVAHKNETITECIRYV